MSLSLSHWYPGSGVVFDLSIPYLCTLTYFDTDVGSVVGATAIVKINLF